VKRSLLALLVWVSPLQWLPARTYQEIPELAKCFQDKGVVGTFLLFEVATDTMFVSDKSRAQKRFTPASTFKIANSLIGLKAVGRG
jgi:beta-lactamase class D